MTYCNIFKQNFNKMYQEGILNQSFCYKLSNGIKVPMCSFMFLSFLFSSNSFISLVPSGTQQRESHSLLLSIVYFYSLLAIHQWDGHVLSDYLKFLCMIVQSA